MYITDTEVPEVNETTQTTLQDEPGTPWYEQIDQYDYHPPERGQVLAGEIVGIDDENIFVDLGLKRTALVPSRDLNQLPSERLQNLSIGDQVMVYVLRQPVGDDDLLVSLAKGLEFEGWERARQAMESGATLELPVTGRNRGGLLIEFESLEGFLPYSLIPELHRMSDRQLSEAIKREMVGKNLPVKVTEVDQARNRLIFSAQAAKEDMRKHRLEELQVGQIVTGPVVSIVKFGVFIDLQGVDGLVHVSRLDWKRVKHPSELLKVGDEITAKVVGIDRDRERISLDRRVLLPGPWESFAAEHHPGDTIEGRVTNVVEFGAFVEVAEGVEGLIHVSELGYTASDNPQSVVNAGEPVLVRILDIDLERSRLSLSMRQVPLEAQIAWSLEKLEANQEGRDGEGSN